MRCETCGAAVPMDQLADHLAQHLTILDAPTEDADPDSKYAREPIPSLMEDRPPVEQQPDDPPPVKALKRTKIKPAVRLDRRS